MKPLEELLDIEFSEMSDVYTQSLELKEYDFSDKDIAIIYFALKNHIGYLSNNGASLDRITRCVELANSLKEETRNYLMRIVNNLSEEQLDEEINDLKIRTMLEN